MYFHGSFISQTGQRVTVYILTKGDRSKTAEIGAESSGIYFDTDPVEIESCVNDTFDHLLMSQAKIRLQVRDYMPEFFCESCFDAVVNIWQGDRCIFAGYIEPQIYSQDYNNILDNLELNCIDALSALQYNRYHDIGSLGVVYEEVKANAEVKSFRQIVNAALQSITASLDITGGSAVRLLYDGTKATGPAEADRYSILSNLGISELLFLGDEEDDVWHRDEVISELLRYLNLHLLQEGFDFYLFSWETVKDFSSIAWKDLLAADDGSETAERGKITITTAIAADTDTQLSVGEVYNQLILTCDVESMENVIESPLDDDLLKSPFSNKQKYLTTFSADGEGVTAWNSFWKMVKHNDINGYDHAKIVDWYLQVMNHPQWVFPSGAYTNLIDAYCQDNAHQENLPNIFPKQTAASIFSLGSVQVSRDLKDNSPVSKLEMDNWLAVSVNGNGSDSQTDSFPTEASLEAAAPVAVYTGNTSGGAFSPADEETTNYIVLSGELVLNPIMDFSANYSTLAAYGDQQGEEAKFFCHTVPCRDNPDGRFYTQKYYKAQTPNAAAEYDSSTPRGLVPFTDDGPQLYEFKYSAVGDGSDTVSKVSVLACMLVIGDKCVVENGTKGQPGDFEWKTYKTREQCASDDEYYAQSFSIGFDPKIGDKLIGALFKFQNNIDYTMGIDAEGIAIPIRKSDKVSGAVKFIILGPVNTLWGDITRRHRTWFRRTKWGNKSVPLLAHVSSILLKSFEVKIYSDNGLINNNGDNDLVYMSDTRENFVNRKDDISFKIHSALTTEECRKIGVSNAVAYSTPVDLSTGDGLLTIYDYTRGAQVKPEQAYVDSYYTEYHLPRVQLTQKLDDKEGIISPFLHYIHPAMGKEFYVQSIDRNLMEGWAQLTLKEIW